MRNIHLTRIEVGVTRPAGVGIERSVGSEEDMWTGRGSASNELGILYMVAADGRSRVKPCLVALLEALLDIFFPSLIPSIKIRRKKSLCGP